MIKNNLEICHTSYEILKDDNKKDYEGKTFTNYKQLLLSCDIGLSDGNAKKIDYKKL